MRDTETISEINVLDETGAPVALRSLWAERPVVLAFVRHFG